jgi:Na+/phosphate symporter
MLDDYIASREKDLAQQIGEIRARVRNIERIMQNAELARKVQGQHRTVHNTLHAVGALS